MLGQGPKEAAPSDPEAAPKKKKKANKRQKAMVEADKYWAALAASPPAHDGDDDVDGPPNHERMQGLSIWGKPKFLAASATFHCQSV